MSAVDQGHTTMFESACIPILSSYEEKKNFSTVAACCCFDDISQNKSSLREYMHGGYTF